MKLILEKDKWENGVYSIPIDGVAYDIKCDMKYRKKIQCLENHKGITKIHMPHPPKKDIVVELDVMNEQIAMDMLLTRKDRR